MEPNDNHFLKKQKNYLYFKERMCYISLEVNILGVDHVYVSIVHYGVCPGVGFCICTFYL